MSKLEGYDFVFLDFDGLLVNTEHLHYQAYQKMCQDRGCLLSWDFPTYCQIAHASSEGIRERIYQDFPVLLKNEPDWAVLYAEKKAAYEGFLEEGKVELMPAVAEFLLYLQHHNIQSCVVTNSFNKQTEAIKGQIPELRAIPYWVTREEYLKAKPSPDPYLAAKEKYAQGKKRTIGFEDTVRGWQSLAQANIDAVVISSCLSDDFKRYLEEKGVSYFPSFNEFLSS